MYKVCNEHVYILMGYTATRVKYVHLSSIPQQENALCDRLVCPSVCLSVRPSVRLFSL